VADIPSGEKEGAYHKRIGRTSHPAFFYRKNASVVRLSQQGIAEGGIKYFLDELLGKSTAAAMRRKDAIGISERDRTMHIHMVSFILLM
jgi:hypothetical protein